MTFEEYFENLDMNPDDVENGFCPFTRKSCMGISCQMSASDGGIFSGCGLCEKGKGE